jgi:hypothetical protein
VTLTRRPPGLSVAGKRLWAAVTGAYELDPHEAVILQNACETADLVAELQAAITANGAILASGKTNPAAAEIRQQRLVLTRLLMALRMPVVTDENRPSGQRRAIRGV